MGGVGRRDQCGVCSEVDSVLLADGLRGQESLSSWMESNLLLKQERWREEGNVNVDNFSWTCQKYYLALYRKKLTNPDWHRQCSQGKTVASNIYDPVYGCNFLKTATFKVKYLSPWNVI